MSIFVHEGDDLGRIHAKSNTSKLHCHFTGFLEGIIASGAIEAGEVEPLLAECTEFISLIYDGDASDIVQDFEADLLEHETLQGAVEIREQKIDSACEKSSLNRFLGFCRGVACDGLITIEEAHEITRRIESNPTFSRAVGVRQIFISCLDAIEDGIVDDEESNEICEAIGAVVGDCYGDTGISQPDGVANFEETRLGDINADLEAKIIVLTGKFRVVPRTGFEEDLAGLGAIVTKSITKKTDYLIVGGKASRDWIEMNRGTKMRKAEKMREQGEKLEFLSEAHLLNLMRS